MQKSKWSWGVLLLLIPAGVYFLTLFLFPLAYGFILSVTDAKGAFSLENYLTFFRDTYEVQSIWNTLLIALPATVINVCIAVPLAYIMRRGIRGEKIITFFLILPITLGTVLVAQGMLKYLSPVGWFNQAVLGVGQLFHQIGQSLGTVDKLAEYGGEAIRLTHNTAGVLISVVLQGFPFAFLMLLGYVSGINPDLEKAAQMLGASKAQTFVRILFPLMVPGIAIAFCLNFVMAFSVFPSAVMLGDPLRSERVIAFAAWQWYGEKATEANHYNMASAIAIIMALVELIVISLVLFWRQRVYRGASIAGKG